MPASQYERVVQQRDDLLTEVAQLKILLDELRQNSLARFNADSRDSRKTILRAVRDRIVTQRPDLNLSIDFERGILRLQGVDLFASSSAQLLNPATINLLAVALREELSCYTYPRENNAGCDRAIGFVDTVYVEGHTDSRPMGSAREARGFNNNLQLSTRRASNTYETLVKAEPDLLGYLNPASQSIMSVAGFGSQRPIAVNETSAGRAKNRRIDIRIEMYAPRDEAEMLNLRAVPAEG